MSNWNDDDDVLEDDRPGRRPARPDEPIDPARLRQMRDGWIDTIRRKVRQPPRRLGMGQFFGPWATPYPPWLKKSDPLSLFYEERRRLLRTGVVVWGALVQANQLMFEKGVYDCPGEVAYCPDPLDPIDPAWLIEAAHDLFALKDRRDLDGELQPIADHLADETTRSFGRLVPRSYIGEHPLSISSMLLFRRHLPGRKLSGSLLPLLVAAEPPRVAMIVPPRFWPLDMRRAYKKSGI